MTLRPAGPAGFFTAAAVALGVAAAALASGGGALRGEAPAHPPLAARPDTVFRHADHRAVSCLSCHSVDPVHGASSVRTLSDCRSCHHTPPESRNCTVCHGPGDAPAEAYALPRVLELTVGRAPERVLPFRHETHTEVACASCHTEGLALSARNLDCASCHQEHHAPAARCATCHLPLPETPPHPVEVHVGCGGAGCHQELPFEGVPRTRAFCVTCHVEQEDHRPGPPCTNCHLLPPPLPTAVRMGLLQRAAAAGAPR